MMIPIKEEVVIINSRTSSSVYFWLYFGIEFFIGIIISVFLSILGIIKSILPKPPRDITGDVILIAGASSKLGESLVNEFARNGCSVVCVDKDLRSIEEITTNLRSQYHRMEEIGPNYSPIATYNCDLLNRDAIRELAKKVHEEIGSIDILVTCVGYPNQDIFETATTTLMSHYWTVLAFLPSLLRRDKAHIIGITPITSVHDAYLSSRAAIAGLMESLGQELSNRNNHLTFLTISPAIGQSSTKKNEQQIAKEVVEAVKRDQSSIDISWSSKMLYQISCMIYNAITVVTQWIHTQGCDYSF